MERYNTRRVETSTTRRYGREDWKLEEKERSEAIQDPYESFPLWEKILFKRFARSVAAEVGQLQQEDGFIGSTHPAQSYQELIEQINTMTFSNVATEVHSKSKRMLSRLFPGWILRQYKFMIAKPFPRFSAVMNAWVTHFATRWLMGNSTVVDLHLEYGENGESLVLVQQGLHIEKCTFLETAGCVRTCVNACKIPTQRFFFEEMGLPVTLKPNITGKVHLYVGF